MMKFIKSYNQLFESLSNNVEQLKHYLTMSDEEKGIELAKIYPILIFELYYDKFINENILNQTKKLEKHVNDFYNDICNFINTKITDVCELKTKHYTIYNR